VSPAALDLPVVDSPAAAAALGLALSTSPAVQESPSDDSFIEDQGFFGPTRRAARESRSRHLPASDVAGVETDPTPIELEIEPKLVNVLDWVGALGAWR